jgi:hypothetical protein
MQPNRPESGEQPQAARPDSKRKRPWVTPELTQLPRLTDLTLQTGSPIDGGGGTGGGGSTVF